MYRWRKVKQWCDRYNSYNRTQRHGSYYCSVVPNTSVMHVSLQWLWVLERIVFKVANRALMLMLCYTFSSSRSSLTSRLNKNFGPVPPIVCLFLASDFLLLDVAPFLSLVHVYETTYNLPILPPHRLCLHLNKDLKKHISPLLNPILFSWLTVC